MGEEDTGRQREREIEKGETSSGMTKLTLFLYLHTTATVYGKENGYIHEIRKESRVI